MTEDDFKDDELINVKLPRKDFLLMTKIIAERRAYNTFTDALKNNWIFVVGAGLLALWGLWDQIHSLIGVKP